MTPEQESALLKSHDDLTKKLAELTPIMAQVPELNTKISNLEKENIELKKGVASSSQESAILALKTKYPDVPEETLRAFPPEIREAQAKTIQDHFSKVKVKTLSDPADPLAAWTRAGGIGPTDDATIAAEQAAKKASLDKSRAAGDVVGMLTSRAAETLAHLKRGLANVK